MRWGCGKMRGLAWLHLLQQRHLLSLPLYLHGLPPASTPETQVYKEKIKQPWNVKCIIQLQPKTLHPPGNSGSTRVRDESPGTVGAGSHCNSFSLTLPPSWLNVSFHPSPLSLCVQCVQLAESGSLLSASPPIVSHFWLLLFIQHLLLNSDSNSPSLFLCLLLSHFFCLCFSLSHLPPSLHFILRSQLQHHLLQEALPDPSSSPAYVPMSQAPRTVFLPTQSPYRYFFYKKNY